MWIIEAMPIISVVMIGVSPFIPKRNVVLSHCTRVLKGVIMLTLLQDIDCDNGARGKFCEMVSTGSQ